MNQQVSRNGIAVGDVVIYSGGFGERPYTVTSIEVGGMRVWLVDSTGHPFPGAVGCYDCRPAHPAATVEPTPAPVAVARPRARRTVTTCTGRTTAVTKPATPALPAVTREYSAAIFRNGRAQRQCSAAVTTDGVWRIERGDYGRGCWIITHQPSGAEVPQWFGTLPRALAAIADGYAARSIATQTTNANTNA